MSRDHLRRFPIPVILIEPREPFQAQTERRPPGGPVDVFRRRIEYFPHRSRQVSVPNGWPALLVWLPLVSTDGQEKGNVGDCGHYHRGRDLGRSLDSERAHLGDGGYGARGLTSAC